MNTYSIVFKPQGGEMKGRSNLRWLVSCHSIARFGNEACHCQPSSFQNAHKRGRKKSQMFVLSVLLQCAKKSLETSARYQNR